jgi:hypothetical protein
MFGTLRRSLFFVALILAILALGLDLGSALLPSPPVSDEAINRVAAQTRTQLEKEDMDDDDRDEMIAKLRRDARKPDKPPGWGIAAMGIVDGIVVYGVFMMALPLLVSQQTHGRLYGLVTLIFSIFVVLASIGVIFFAFIKTLIMVALFTAAPFGTIAYLAIWGFFDRGGATVILSLSMLVKLFFVGFLIAAHPRFLQSKGLVLMILTSLLCTFLIGFLHGFPPIILVSITDMIAAIIIGIIGLIWGIVLLIFSIFGVVKAIA